VQIADVSGVYGVSFLIAAVNLALAELCLALGGAARPVRQACVDLGLVGTILAAVLGYGVVRLHADSSGATAVEPTQVAVIQGNVNLGSQWREEFYGRNFDHYVRLTRTALEERGPTLIVWPENTMTFFLEGAVNYQEALGHLLSARGAQLLAGGPRWDADAAGAHYYNSMFLIAPEGGILARYDKEQLLPLAESFPLGSGRLVRRQFGGVQEFTPGIQSGPLPTVAGPAGILICNEVMFPEIAGARVRAGANFLVNPSNDSWIPSPQFSAQALDMARMRAIEQRRYLVRASTSGPSAIVDPWGRILSETAPATQATISGAVRPETAITPYGRFGDMFGIVCAVVTFLRLASPPCTRRRRTADPSAR
jgi:apolipoprotein N-acyltransferase